jgi:hypothetical protein
MATSIKLDLLLVETYSSYALSIADFSVYPSNYTPVSPTIQITATGFNPVTLAFEPQAINTFTSAHLGLSDPSSDITPLPDGIYEVKYTINPAYQHFVEKTFLKVNAIQEKFDKAFMKMDMMECDNIIRRQRKEELDSIYYFIQGAIAAANECAPALSIKMYRQADKMLDNFITNKCNCNG